MYIYFFGPGWLYTYLLLTLPQFIYSTAVSRNKKYTKSPWVKELTKFGAENRKRIKKGSVINNSRAKSSQ